MRLVLLLFALVGCTQESDKLEVIHARTLDYAVEFCKVRTVEVNQYRSDADITSERINDSSKQFHCFGPGPYTDLRIGASDAPRRLYVSHPGSRASFSGWLVVASEARNVTIADFDFSGMHEEFPIALVSE